MRKLFLPLVMAIALPAMAAQSYNERIANAINASEWFELDSIYSAAPKDSIVSFLEVYTRGLIGNRLNRPDISIPAFEELLNNHSAELDLQNLLNSAVMLSMDLSRMGDNVRAAAIVMSMLDATRQYLDTAAIKSMQHYIDLYTAFSAYKPYTVSFENETGSIPFRIVTVGNPQKGSILMHLDDSYINGVKSDITFDTGAGVNMISDSLANILGLIPLDAYNNVAGIGVRSARCAIAKELHLGNIMLHDVPFCVLDMSTGNAEADRHIANYSIVVGSELMLQLKDLTINFVDREITVPAVAPARSGTAPNICFSSQMNLLTKGRLHGDSMWICLDTGDASYGTLNRKFFLNNQEYVKSCSQLDTVRTAGIGGVNISECYILPDVMAELGGSRIILPGIAVNPGEYTLDMDYECNLGLKSIMRFGKVRFNMVDFTISTSMEAVTHRAPKCHIYYSTQAVECTEDKSPGLLKTIGFIATAIANGLLNDNAPAAPDL